MIQIIILRDLDSNEHAITAVKVHNSELNGQDDLQVTINQQKNNDLDLKTVSELWEIEYKDINYKIVHVKQQTRGNSFYLDVRAIPLFYWEFDKSIIHADNDGSHTANEAFRIVFENTGYNFVLVDFSPAVSWEGFGKGSTRLELFKRLLDRYNYEFIVDGTTVYMHHLIGNDTNFMYKYKLNASNVSLSTDASAYFTHVKGFGDFEEGEEDYLNNAKLMREATSPLASVVGHWEGKPLVDGRVTQSDTMDEMLQTALEESLQVTVEGTLHDVRKIYDIAIPVKGDRVWLHDERINLEREIRLQSIKTTYDEQDNIIACDVTFGSESIGKRYKANINSLSKKFADLLNGKLTDKIPIISLEQVGMDMIKNIHDASSEIVFGDFGMMAISKTNPNHVFGVNSEGWYISQDGGATPRTIATAEGIYADALFAGTLWLTNEMNIESADGYLNVTGSRFVMRSKDTPVRNLFNASRMGTGSISSSDGTVQDDSFLNTGFIALEPNSTYSTGEKGTGALYNDDYNYVEALTSSTTQFTTKSNVWYMRSTLSEAQSQLFTVYKESGIKNAVEITPDGITIYGFDGRETVVDGIMRGERVANINTFYDEEVVTQGGRNLRWESYDNQLIYYIDDLYNGRFLDLLVATGLSGRSASSSAHAIVTVRDFPGAVLARERFIIYRQDSSNEMDYRSIRSDLQALFNTVPDYRPVKLYVEVELDSGYSGNEILFRINRGAFYA